MFHRALLSASTTILLAIATSSLWRKRDEFAPGRAGKRSREPLRHQVCSRQAKLPAQSGARAMRDPAHQGQAGRLPHGGHPPFSRRAGARSDHPASRRDPGPHPRVHGCRGSRRDARRRARGLGGALSVCEGAGDQRIGATVEYTHNSYGGAVRFVWSHDGTVFLTGGLLYPMPGNGTPSARVGRARLTCRADTWTLSVQTPGGAELARGSVTRSAYPFDVLGFATFPSTSIPGVVPASLTPNGGTITGCAADRVLVVYAREKLPAGTGYLQLGVDPLGGGAPKQLVASAPGSIVFIPFWTDAGATLPLLNGPWTFAWLADGSSDLVSANVTLAC